MAQLATQQDASPLVAALLRGGEAGLGEGRSPLSPSLGGLDLYSPVSVLMGNLTAVETHKQLGACAPGQAPVWFRPAGCPVGMATCGVGAGKLGLTVPPRAPAAQQSQRQRPWRR